MMNNEISKEELDFYLRETEVSSIQKAILSFSLPNLDIKNMQKVNIIAHLILLKDFLIKKQFKLLPIFLLCTIEGLDKIHKNEKKKSLEEILIDELSSPIRVISYEHNQTRENGDMFVYKHKIDLIDELKYYMQAVSDSRNRGE